MQIFVDTDAFCKCAQRGAFKEENMEALTTIMIYTAITIASVSFVVAIYKNHKQNHWPKQRI